MNENLEYDDNEFTTREEQTKEATLDWLAGHPESSTTANNLYKTVRQLITEIFQTGDRAREALGTHALVVAAHAQVDQRTLTTIRSFTNADPIPSALGKAFYALGSALAPLADAIQGQRERTTDWTVAIATERCLLKDAENAGVILTRDDLRGFVASRLRSAAVNLHAELGPDRSSKEFAEALTDNLPAVAEEVADAAVQKRTAEVTLTAEAKARLENCVEENFAAMARLADRFASEAGDTLGDSLVKLTLAHRAHPELVSGTAYALTVVRNSGRTRASEAKARLHDELPGLDAVTFAGRTADETLLVDVKDSIAHRVREVAGRLAANAESSEHRLAADALMSFFIKDTGELWPEILHLSANDGREVRDGLTVIATRLAPSKAAAARVTKLALSALRTGEAA